VYAERAGGTTADWRTVMAEETWYGAEEAVEAGLADQIRAVKADDDEPAAAAAHALSGSRFAARFRYQGRAAAPAPRRPVADRRRADTQEGSRNVEFTTDQLATLRQLGLPADQDPATFVAAVAEALNEQEQTTTTTAQLPDGVRTIDADVLAQLQADAAQGRAAREEQVTARRVAKVDAAIRAGKLPPAARDRWLTNLAADEEAFTATLDGLQPVIPTEERGHDDGSQDKTAAYASIEDVLADPTYKAIWRS
jgi:hypothetical protein